ncbi:O-antigen ligase family protein [Candidatus Daviesbacteria bacterium]|nr:O-antigen ligase family protein [Candidatus Daviesbacteria bacterium]
MLDKIIFISYALCFSLVPLIFTPFNFELFEFNKMILVYFLTTVIVGTWVLKMISQKSLIIKRTPLDIPLLLFLASQILSTIFSTDAHISIWGYYSRLNGGLFSTVSYLLLYFAFVSNVAKEQLLKLLKIALLSGVVISLWAISEHFGLSPSCVILRGEFNTSCWVQDVQARVFATLGQPNWLAAYLAMLIFPALYFYLTATKKIALYTYYIILTTYYLAFTFTYSRGGTLGLIAGMAVFILLTFRKLEYKNIIFKSAGSQALLITVITFILINLLFGSALTRFNLTQLPASQRDEPAATTQLETGGTESGQIRLIVWQGAFNIFKAYPIFGSGVETFALSYYQFRPAVHNLTSEWDFLYNKAHNEFLNYLANTGIVGLGSYSIIIITFIIFALKKLKKQNINPLLLISLLASYLSYLVQNFFGFSVVIIALFFYLFPAIIFVASDSTRSLKFPKILHLIYRRPFYTRVAQLMIILSTLYLLFSILKLWYADSLFAQGERNSEVGNPGRAYNFLTAAASINPHEPFYRSELAYAAAASALALNDIDASLSATLKNQAIAQTEAVLNSNPKNISFWRTAIRTYFELSALDKDYTQKTIEALNTAINLAPSDPKLYYNKAVILGQIDEGGEAIKVLQKAIEQKPNYRDAYYALALFQFDAEEKEKAVETMKKVLQISPSDPEALEKLKEWEK